MEEYVLTPLENLQNIADAVRESTGQQNKSFSADQCTKIVPGLITGDYSQIYEDAQSEFFNNYIKGGKHFVCSFSGNCWNQNTFKPKQNLCPDYTFGLFKYFNYSGYVFDLVAHLDKLGVNLDFSKSTSLYELFSYAYVTRVGVISCISATKLEALFSESLIETIDKWIVCENNTFYRVFTAAKKLKNITIEGIIANNGLDLKDCVDLTHDSIMSFINALKDFSGTTTTKSITFGATNLAKLTDEEKLLATQKGWTLA